MRHTYKRLRDELNIHPKHMTMDLDKQELTVNLTNSTYVTYNTKHLRWYHVTSKTKAHKYIGTLDAFFNWVKAKLDGRPLL